MRRALSIRRLFHFVCHFLAGNSSSRICSQTGSRLILRLSEDRTNDNDDDNYDNDDDDIAVIIDNKNKNNDWLDYIFKRSSP